MSAPGGCLLLGGVSQHALRQTPPREQNDKQVQKYYLGHNFVAAGNYVPREMQPQYEIKIACSEISNDDFY